MEEQLWTEAVADPASWQWRASRHETVKHDNRAYLVAAYGSWPELRHRPVIDPREADTQPIPAAYAEGYLTLT